MTKGRLDRLTHILLRALHLLGMVMVAVGCGTMLTRSFRGPTVQSLPMRMETPCTIRGRTQIYVEGERLYLFCEEESAVNVYDLDGTFLFRAQGSRFSNGIGSVALWGQEIYLTSRDHKLIRFDKDGNCLGWAEDGWFYDAQGRQTDVRYLGKMLYFDEEGICFRARAKEDKKNLYFYMDASGVYPLEVEDDDEVIRTLGGTHYTGWGKPVTVGEVTYKVSQSQLQKIENGQKTVLSQGSTTDWYLGSWGIQWITAMMGGLLCKMVSILEKRPPRIKHDTSRNEPDPGEDSPQDLGL